MHEYYGKSRAQRVEDVEWIREMTEQGFALLSADHRILVNPLEQEAVSAAGARAFVLPNGNMTGAEQAARFERHRANIDAKASVPGPAGFVVYENYLSRVYP